MKHRVIQLLHPLFSALYILLSSLLLHPSEVSAENGSVQLCLTEAADYSPVYPTRVFPSNTREIAAVAHLGATDTYKVMTGTWIAVDVGKAAPPNTEVAKADITLDKMKKLAFRLSVMGSMPVGKYRLDVMADGKPWKSTEFTVVEVAKAPEMKKPEDLLPLRQGQMWTYAFVQQPGEGAKITLPGVTPDPEGKFRATVTMAVADKDAAGTRLDLKRNGALVFQEWWRLDENGLVSTQRKAVNPQVKDAMEDLVQNPVIKLDPPQQLLRWPLTAPQTWTYTPKDGAYSQTIRSWGPLPIKGPSGEAPGYLIFLQQKERLGTLTAERHWIPGVGLVREIIISTVGDKLAGRTEMVLQK